jgi:hypothetical protein
MGSYSATWEYGVLTHFQLKETEMNVYTINLDTNEVATFTSKKEAKDAMPDAIIIANEADISDALTVGQMVTVYNALEEKPITKFENKTKGATRLFSAILAKFPKVKKEKAPGTRAQNREKVIRILVSDNPRREGTAGYRSFALIKDGMTVGAYLEAGGRMVDLRWDEKKKNIKIEG